MIAFWQEGEKRNCFFWPLFLFPPFFLLLFIPFLAYLKIELLPASWFPGQRQHVSLLEAVFFRGKRRRRGFAFSQSDIRQAIISWLSYDKILLFGAWATSSSLGGKNLIFLALFWQALFLLFLARWGGLGFYLIPQIAFWAISIPLVLKPLASV